MKLRYDTTSDQGKTAKSPTPRVCSFTTGPLVEVLNHHLTLVVCPFLAVASVIEVFSYPYAS